MKNLKSILSTFFVVFIFIGAPVLANAQFRMDGLFRPRTEFRDGYRMMRDSNTDPAFFISQRARLNLSYQTERYKMKLSGQDVRVWGDVAQLQDNSNVNIHEAWAQVDLSSLLAVKLGRQELVYGDQRLLGSVNWTQQARSHDALVLKYNDEAARFNLDIGAAYNQEAERVLGNTYTLNNYKVLSYLQLKKDFGSFNISALALTDGFQAADVVNYRYTYGVDLGYRTTSWSFAGSAYQQDGDDATRQDIDAQMFTVKVSHNTRNVNLSLGFDYLSGGKASEAKPARHTFSTLYATNHKFYGNMDYFLNIPVDTKGGGLQDLHAGALFHLSGESDLGITYHHFALGNEIQDPTDPGSKLNQNLGSEFDLNFSQKFSDDITLKLGYSTLFPTSSLQNLQLRTTDKMQHWGWAMLIITPQFVGQ